MDRWVYGSNASTGFIEEKWFCGGEYSEIELEPTAPYRWGYS
jgi:hypothetical protein